MKWVSRHCLRAYLLLGGAILGPLLVPGQGTLLGETSSEQAAATRIRWATFNVSLSRSQTGALIKELQNPEHQQARDAAEIIQRVRPDVLLLNEFDFDPQGEAIGLFLRNFLNRSQADQQGMEFPHRYLAPVNTGIPSGLDLNRDGELGGPADAFGYGRHPGHYGMVVLSRFPIAADQIRTFQHFRWRDLPDARRPRDPASGEPYYSDAVWAQLRLSSKSHWDIPLLINGKLVHFLVCHPTPPVFDGPEDRNGCRNYDEIRLWADYISPGKADYLVDDQGQRGGLGADEPFVIAGDLNADPERGQSAPNAIGQLLDHPRIDSRQVPLGSGAREQRSATANFGRRTGMMRVDYVLPSKTLSTLEGGVFWPDPNEPGGEAVRASDHRLVWIDIELP